MRAGDVLMELTKMGFRFRLDGEVIKVRYESIVRPDPETVKPLLEQLKKSKDEVMALIREVSCQDCVHSWCGVKYCECQDVPWDGEVGQWCLEPHPCHNFHHRREAFTRRTREGAKNSTSHSQCPKCGAKTLLLGFCLECDHDQLLQIYPGLEIRH